MSQYEQDLEPLLDCVDIIFQTELIPFIAVERHKYKEAFLSSDTSKRDFSSQIKSNVVNVLNLLSKQYITKLKQLYFSDDGLILYIFTSLYKLADETLKE
jgi:hypothetical protein